MKKDLRITVFTAALLLSVGIASGENIIKMNSKQNGAWVLSYFKGGSNSAEENSLYLAYSTDGLHWEELNGGRPVFTASCIGGSRIRDPFLFRKNDGTFILIATDWTIYGTPEAVSPDYWGNPSPYLILADSDDLITFTNVRRVKFALLSGQAAALRRRNGWKDMHCWAPEIFWDAAIRQYGVIWSGDGSLDGKNNINRTYINYTADFMHFSEPEVFFELKHNGLNVTEIDATMIQHDGKWYLFFKGEIDDAKDIQEAYSRSLLPGSFKIMYGGKYITRTTNQNKQQYTEGPFIIKAEDKGVWYLYADFYLQDGIFGCWKTDNLENPPEKWDLLSSCEYSFPSGVRHANTLCVTAEELEHLKNKLP